MSKRTAGEPLKSTSILLSLKGVARLNALCAQAERSQGYICEKLINAAFETSGLPEPPPVAPAKPKPRKP